MKIKVRYAIPVITFIKGYDEIEINEKSLDQISFKERIEIMEKIAENQGYMSHCVEDAYDFGYAKLIEIKDKDNE